MNIFISHISEEAEIASVLKEWIDTTFLGNCSVFVSSDAASLPAGTRWLDQIDAALRTANVMVVLCSQTSVGRPWVNFETGCAWARGIPVVPVCHSGVSRGSLPRPLAEFQALDATDDAFPSLFLSALATHLNVKKLPKLDAASMAHEVRAAISTFSEAVEPDRGSAKSEARKANLPGEAMNLLRFLSEQSGSVPPKLLASVLGENAQRTEYVLDLLKDEKLVDMHLVMGQGAFYKLSKKGRSLLFGSAA